MWQGDKMLVIFPLVLPTLNSKPFITNSIHHEMIYFKLKYMSHPEVHKFNLLSGLISYQHLITEKIIDFYCQVFLKHINLSLLKPSAKLLFSSIKILGIKKKNIKDRTLKTKIIGTIVFIILKIGNLII